MKHIQRVVGGLLWVVISASMAIAGGQDRAGTAAAPELTIPVGARYLAMGGAPVALATGLEAIYWNPAGLDLAEKGANMMFSHRRYIADIAMNYFAVSGKFGIGSLGFSLRTFAIGDINVTTEFAPDGTGEKFSPTFFVGGLTYSNQLTDRISVGATVNVINESFARVGATGISLDAGVQYQGLAGVKGLMLGVAIKNVGPAMRYGGAGLWVEAQVPGSERGVTFYKVQAASFDLPSVVEIGGAYRWTIGETSKLDITGTYQNNNYAYDEYRVGVEYGYNDLVYLRGGYLFGAGATDRIPHIFENFSAGAGVHLANIGGLDLAIDYAFAPVKWFDDNHVFAVKLGF